jgi:hypothetical protein
MAELTSAPRDEGDPMKDGIDQKASEQRLAFEARATSKSGRPGA